MGYSDDSNEEVLTKDRCHGARGVNITTSDVEIMTKTNTLTRDGRRFRMVRALSDPATALV